MSWITIALLSASVSALVSIFDKTVLFRYATTPKTLPLLIGLAQTSVGLVVLLAVRIPDEATWSAAGWALLSGVLFGLSGLLLMRVLYTQEVSRTIPVTQTAPIFAALIGLTFLDESLSALQWTAILATVVGAALLSYRAGGGYGSVVRQRPFYLLMFGALLMATANVGGKVALDDLPVLFTHGLRMLSLGLVFLLANARREPWQDIRGFVTNRSPALLFVGANELLIANTGLLLMLWALSLGPVALVTALVGTRAMFVVVYSTGLALIWKGALGEETTAQAITVKAASTALIVGGVWAIAA
ncbi:MAG: EamA family transporter [Dehalococcoidia bacterium]